MCQKKSFHLTKENFTIPPDWEPTSENLKRIRERREEIVGILGPTLLREILAEVGLDEEEDYDNENSDSC
jgi:hypothetical protein